MEDFNEKNMTLKNWLKKVKNYYKTFRWLKGNNVKGKWKWIKNFTIFI